MSIQYERSLDIATEDQSVGNSTTETSLYSATIDGGLLGSNNRVDWDMIGAVQFAGAHTLTLRAFYAGVTVSTCTIGASGAAGPTGLTVKVSLRADGSANAQFCTISGIPGLAYSADTSVPVGYGTASVSSGSDQTFSVTGQWDNAASGTTVTCSHATLKLLGWNTETAAPSLDEPVMQILTNSKLNKLNYTLRKSVYFYSPLEHDLSSFCYGSPSFTRSGATVATWRDGGSHTVIANSPRFEYSGETVLGMAINTSSETLTFDTDNALSDGNDICWLEDNVYKSTYNGDSNPFNGSGEYAGTSGVHVSHFVKFNKSLTAAENSQVEEALTS